MDNSLKVVLFLGCLATSQGGSKMMMAGEIMENNQVANIILSHDLNMDVQRQNRDTSQFLDQNLQPVPFPGPAGGGELPEGILPPTDIPEGFDLSTVEAQEDGQFCVFKTIPIEGIEKIPVQQCVHRVDKQCYFSYVTQYTPTTEDFCTNNYKKKCYIEYTKTAVTETIEKCYHPMERVCSPPKYGEVPNEVCQTQYETSCVTKYKDTPVVENVEECNKVYKKVCEYVKEGYGQKKVCSNKPVNECGTVSKTVFKKLPDTTCERIPFEACAPDNCEFIPGEPICHNKTVDIGIDSPEEVCDLQPQKMCKQVYRLVPKLSPQEICEDVPREVCFTTLKNPRKVITPLLTKWCFKPETEEEEPEQGYGAPVPHYPPPPQLQYPPPSRPQYPPPPAPQYPPQYPPPSYPSQPPPAYSPAPAYKPQPKYGNILSQPPPRKYGFKLVEPSLPPFLPPQGPTPQGPTPQGPSPPGRGDFNFPEDFSSQDQFPPPALFNAEGQPPPQNFPSQGQFPPQDQFPQQGLAPPQGQLRPQDQFSPQDQFRSRDSFRNSV